MLPTTVFLFSELTIEDNLNLEEIRIRASTFDIKYVTISGNPKLTSITFDAHTGGTNGRKIGSMAINNNEELTTLTLNVNGITSYGGLEDSQLYISNNPKLTTIDMKSVTEIDIASDVIIEDNANLKAIAFEHLKAVKTQFGTLVIRKNDMLEKLELKVQNGIEVNGKLLVQANIAMTQIVLQADSLNLGSGFLYFVRKSPWKPMEPSSCHYTRGWGEAASDPYDPWGSMGKLGLGIIGFGEYLRSWE